MREKLAILLAAVVIGGLVGGGGIYVLTRATPASMLVGGRELRYWVKCLGGDETTVRAQAVTALPQFGADAVEPVVLLLDHEPARDPAAKVLATIGQPAMPAIIRTLRDGPANRRLGALKALDGMTFKPSAEAIDLAAEQLRWGEDESLLAQNFLTRVGPTDGAIDTAISVLQDSASVQQTRAMRVLGCAKPDDPRVVQALCLAMERGESKYVAQAAFDAVRTMKTPPGEYAYAMLSYIDPSRWGLRSQQVERAIKAMGAPAIPSLRRATTHPSSHARAFAADMIGILAPLDRAAADNVLLEFVKDSDVTVWDHAMQGLDKASRRDETFICTQLEAKSRQAREWAVRMLTDTRPSDATLDRLIGILSHDPPMEVRGDVLHVLAIQSNRARVSAAVRRATTNPSYKIAEAARSVAKALPE